MGPAQRREAWAGASRPASLQSHQLSSTTGARPHGRPRPPPRPPPSSWGCVRRSACSPGRGGARRAGRVAVPRRRAAPVPLRAPGRSVRGGSGDPSGPPLCPSQPCTPREDTGGRRGGDEVGGQRCDWPGAAGPAARARLVAVAAFCERGRDRDPRGGGGGGGGGGRLQPPPSANPAAAVEAPGATSRKERLGGRPTGERGGGGAAPLPGQPAAPPPPPPECASALCTTLCGLPMLPVLPW